MRIIILVLLIPLCMLGAFVYQGPAEPFFRCFYVLAALFYSYEMTGALMKRHQNKSPNCPQRKP